MVDWTYQNGILHTIDGVMKPPEGNFYDILTENPAFSSFLKYIKLAGLQETMKKQTPMTRENHDLCKKKVSELCVAHA